MLISADTEGAHVQAAFVFAPEWPYIFSFNYQGKSLGSRQQKTDHSLYLPILSLLKLPEIRSVGFITCVHTENEPLRQFLYFRVEIERKNKSCCNVKQHVICTYLRTNISNDLTGPALGNYYRPTLLNTNDSFRVDNYLFRAISNRVSFYVFCGRFYLSLQFINLRCPQGQMTLQRGMLTQNCSEVKNKNQWMLAEPILRFLHQVQHCGSYARSSISKMSARLLLGLRDWPRLRVAGAYRGGQNTKTKRG